MCALFVADPAHSYPDIGLARPVPHSPDLRTVCVTMMRVRVIPMIVRVVPMMVVMVVAVMMIMVMIVRRMIVMMQPLARTRPARVLAEDQRLDGHRHRVRWQAD